MATSLVCKSNAFRTPAAHQAPTALTGLVDPISAEILVSRVGAKAEAKTYSITPNPLIVTGDAGVLWTMEDMKVTYVRAVDQPTGVTTCFITVSMYQTGHGWYLFQGVNLHFLSETTGGGLLEDWNTGALDAGCGYSHVLKTYTKQFRPDWYDIINGVQVVWDAGGWHRCAV